MKIEITASALRAVLVAINGPEHYIREMQAARRVGELTGDENPIDVLMREYGEQTRVSTGRLM